MSGYLFKVSSIAALVLLLVASLNILIDPFGLWEIERIAGINLNKKAFTSGLQQSKPHRLQLDHPRVLLLGSSRVGEGLSCDMLNEASCFNAALPGGSLYESLRLLQQAGDDIDSVYLGLDFEAALKPREPAPGYTEARFPYRLDGSYNLGYPWQSLRDYVTLSIAADTSLHSTQTVLLQPASNSPGFERSLASDGSWHLLPLGPATSAAQAAQMQARVYRVIRGYSRVIIGQVMATEPALLERRRSAFLSLLAELQENASARGATLHLFINPSHALYLDVLREQGASEQWMLWLAELQDFAQSRELTIWNFAGYNSYSISALPLSGFNPYFNDPVHYSRLTGMAMMSRMQTACDSAGFGQCLQSQDLQRYTEQFETAGDEFAKTLQTSGFLRPVAKL